MLTAQKTKAPPQDTPRRYYHIPKGCAAEARPLTGGEWRVRCPERDLWLPVTGYDGLDLLFRDDEWEWRVAGEIVGYC